MDYKRFTEKHKDSGYVSDLDCRIAYNKLSELEDKIENKTLVEMPCKVGDTLYEPVIGVGVEEWEIILISFTRIYPEDFEIVAERKPDLVRWKFVKFQIGKTIFTTKEQAEAKLKKLQSEE